MKRRQFGALLLTSVLAGCSTGDPDDTKTERVVIENRSESPVEVELDVQQDGESLLSGCYRIPSGIGVKFSREIEWGEYLVRGRFQGGEWQSMDWEPRSCSSTPAEDGNMNAGLIVKEDRTLSITHNVCDYMKLGAPHYVEEYRTPSEFEVSC